MTQQKFIGITIGPIYRTFQKAEKTREIWGASYLFSYLCKSLLQEIIAAGVTESMVLLPHSKGINLAKPGVGLYPDRILIEASDDTFDRVKSAVTNVKRTLSEEMLLSIKSYSASDPYAKLLKRAIAGRGKQAREFLSDYLQVYCIEASPDEIALEDYKVKLGSVKSMNVLLDHLELRTSVSGFDPDPIKVFLRGINHSFLLKDAFGEEFKHFPSLPEISTTELRFISEQVRGIYDLIVENDYQILVNEERSKIEVERKKLVSEPEDDVTRTDFQNVDEIANFVEETESDLGESELLDKLFKIEGINDFKRTYHKYVAIVHADGDRMGKLIGKQLKENEVAKFSEDLIEFAIAANKVLAGTRFTKDHDTDWGYGAAPIFIGGDDIVFFAPVASRNISGDYMTVFHLVQKLDVTFDKIFNAKGADGNYINYPDIEEKNRPCMTYGVSITYIKHPLREAFFQSYDLMNSVKNDDYITRNRINFKVQKHSGQWFGGVIDKNNLSSFNAFLQLLDEKNTSSLQGNTAEQFINSLSQKLRFYQTVIEERAKLDDPSDFKIAMEALFDNALDEGVHKENEEYLHTIRDLLITMLSHIKSERTKLLAERMKNGKVLSEKKAKEDEAKYYKQITEAIDTLHGMLRFIHFIRDNEFRN